jgi:hypothetical protein
LAAFEPPPGGEHACILEQRWEAFRENQADLDVDDGPCIEVKADSGRNEIS